MRIVLTGLLATTMLTGAAAAQELVQTRSDDHGVKQEWSVADAAPVITQTPEERAREYNPGDNEPVITEAQPGVADGVPGGQQPVRPHTAGENAVIDETPGIGDDAGAVASGGDAPVRPHTAGENAVIDETPGMGDDTRTMATGDAPMLTDEAQMRPHTEGENAVIDEELNAPGTTGYAASNEPIRPHTAGENAVIDETPGVGDDAGAVPSGGDAPMRPHTAGENAVIDETPGQ